MKGREQIVPTKLANVSGEFFHFARTSCRAYLATVLDFGGDGALRRPRRRAKRQATELFGQDARARSFVPPASERGRGHRSAMPYQEMRPQAARSFAPLDNSPAVTDKTAMFRRLGHLLLAIALIGATGGHWAALQSVAWAAMFADNARVEPISVALEKTFDGKHPCPLCKQIAKCRQAEKKSDTRFEVKKLEFLRASTAFVFIPPSQFTLLGNDSSPHPLLAQTPLLPPPRTLPG